MKNYKKIILGFTNLMVGSFMLSSCNNLDEPSLAKQETDKKIISSKVENLVQKAFVKEASADEIEKFVLDYRSMNTDELNTFNDEQIAKKAKEIANNPAGLEELEKVAAMRIEVNKLSNAKFKKPYNQLSPDQLNTLMDEFEGKSEGSKSSKVASTASCGAWFFDRSYTRGTIARFGADYLATVNAYRAGTQPDLANPDCDCRIGFGTTAYNRVVPSGNVAGSLLGAFGNNIGGRIANGGTYFIVGQKRANLYYAGFGCTGVFYDFKLGN